MLVVALVVQDGRSREWGLVWTVESDHREGEKESR